jgi:hypothetical protein
MKSTCEVGFLNDPLLDSGPDSFVSPEITFNELQTILTSHSVSTLQWGAEESKSVKSLLREVQRGICDLKLVDDRLTRVCLIVRVEVFDGKGNQLVETKQEFNHSKLMFLRPKRYRIRPDQKHINKKVKYKWWDTTVLQYKCEPVPLAARRALFEELQIPREDISKIEYFSQNTIKCYTPSSQSYPELPTYYFITRFEVHLGNPNTKHLIKDFYIHKGKEVITTFQWQPIKQP